jgi:hypothetical protein
VFPLLEETRVTPTLHAIRSTLLFTCALLCPSTGQDAQGQAVTGLKVVRAATGLSSPLFVTAPASDTSQLFIVQQGGAIRILNLSNLTLNSTSFINLSGSITTSGSEQGLLGLAFAAPFIASSTSACAAASVSRSAASTPRRTWIAPWKSSRTRSRR